MISSNTLFNVIYIILLYNTPKVVDAIFGFECENGPPIFHGCNTCKCLDGFFTDCTKYRCNLDNASSLYVNCVESEIKIENCHVCVCRNETWICGGRVCNINDDTRSVRSLRDIECFEEEYKADDCRECKCTNGKWICTNKFCANSYRSLRQVGLEAFFGQTELEGKIPPCVRLDQFTIQCNSSSKQVRMVNHKFKIAAEDLLNKNFKKIEPRLQCLKTLVCEAIQITNDDMEIKCFCKLLDTLELVIFHVIPDLVLKICQLTKRFCIHFDKFKEERMKSTLTASGCKIVDLLDCGQYVGKKIFYENIEGNKFEAKYSYYLQNAWFVTLKIPNEKSTTLSEQQRLMHMRIRRMIVAHTEMFMQQNQYSRETLLRMNPLIKKPSCLVYTGYGEVEETFFCYGVMNDAAYMQKFHVLDVTNFDNDDDENDDLNDPEDNDMNMNNLENPGFYIIPYLGLEIQISIECPKCYAPYRYLSQNPDKLTENKIVPIKNNKSPETLHINLVFESPGNFYPRVPTTYTFQRNIAIHK